MKIETDGLAHELSTYGRGAGAEAERPQAGVRLMKWRDAEVGRQLVGYGQVALMGREVEGTDDDPPRPMAEAGGQWRRNVPPGQGKPIVTANAATASGSPCNR